MMRETFGLDNIYDMMVISLIIIAVISAVTVILVIAMSYKMSGIIEALYRLERSRSDPSPKRSSLLSGHSSAPAVKNVGNTWTCPDCGTENPLTSRICKDCGREK